MDAFSLCRYYKHNAQAVNLTIDCGTLVCVIVCVLPLYIRYVHVTHAHDTLYTTHAHTQARAYNMHLPIWVCERVCLGIMHSGVFSISKNDLGVVLLQRGICLTYIRTNYILGA